jgi:drug/metabolite transporter (DMT)-like permease
MNTIQILSCVLCAVGIGAGQLLFKLASNRIHAGQSFLQFDVLSILALSFGVYFVTSLFWVWILRSVPLSKGYPVLALVYVMVPLSAAFLFRETLSPTFWLGVILICGGIVLTVQGGIK